MSSSARIAALIRIAYNSCRNRHCPKCQGLARAEWLAERQAELLPVPYFHVVFTLPAPVGRDRLPEQGRRSMPSCSARRPRRCATIAADPKHLGAEIGIVAVLHTWGQTLQHHPHVHCVVPGGGPSLDGTRWVACRPGFFLPVRVLSRLFRRLFLENCAPPSRPASSASSARSPTSPIPTAFARRLARAAAGRVGGLRQAAVRRPRTGAGLSRPLHPSRRHRQQPAGQRSPTATSPSAGRTTATTARPRS